MKVEDWESRFEKKLQQIAPSERHKPGALLPLIPSREEWEEFIEHIQSEWRIEEGYYSVRRELPHCFSVLYGGVAFFKYEENRFWQHFAEEVKSAPLSTNKRDEINEDFARIAEKFGLTVLRQANRTNYVGSAVYHIGIPLSLWDDFIKLCAWTLWHDEWQALADDEWAELVNKRVHTSPRLRKFLIENRETATALIREMHDARRILTEDETLTIHDLKQACLLRQEYFDEVPETAEFLRPSNPDSLFKDRARLIWDEDRARISLYLPAVSRGKLPATWKVDDQTLPASATADILKVNSTAFTDRVLLKLEADKQSEMQRLRGLVPFGLFDCERNKFVNPEREILPLGNYALLAREALCDLHRRGFEDEENPANEMCELEDGTPYHVTRLCPADKSAAVSFSLAGKTLKIAFRSGLKIEARIFAGEGSYAAGFSHYQQWIKVERLPLLCLAVPFGSFEQSASILQRKFQVCVGEQAMEGVWEKRHEDEQQEFYTWRWDHEPQPKKKVAVSIKAPELGFSFTYQIEMRQPKPDLADCWQNMPGAFLPWFLLAQPGAGMKEGMKWQELLLAKEAIAPADKTSLSYLRYCLREYVNCGLIAQQGHTWRIAESRAKFELADDGSCQMSYCGNPSILWGLFRYLHEQAAGLPLPQIAVVNRRGELPYLFVEWKAEQQRLAQKYLNNQKQHNVHIVSDLWRP